MAIVPLYEKKGSAMESSISSIQATQHSQGIPMAYAAKQGSAISSSI